MDLAGVLPNLSIGVVAIGAIVYIVRDFLKRMREKDQEFYTELEKQRKVFDCYVKEVQQTMVTQISENTKVLDKVADYLNKQK